MENGLQSDWFQRAKMWDFLTLAFSAYQRDIHYRTARPFEAGYRDLQFYILDGVSQETIDRAIALGYFTHSVYSNDKGKEIYVIQDKGMLFLRNVETEI